MNNSDKIELMKLAVQLVINTKTPHLIAPKATMDDKTTELVAMVYKSLLGTLTESD